MSRRRPKSHSLPSMLILTAADGFTTAVEEQGELMREATRCVLLAPIRVVHWVRVSVFHGYEWKRVAEWTWDGGIVG